jgi:hypothetical protein
MSPLSPETIRKDQSVLNRATQGTYIDDDVKDMWFFYKAVQPISSLGKLFWSTKVKPVKTIINSLLSQRRSTF